MPSGSYDAVIVLCTAIGHSDFTVPYLISASLICIDLLCRLYTDAPRQQVQHAVATTAKSLIMRMRKV